MMRLSVRLFVAFVLIAPIIIASAAWSQQKKGTSSKVDIAPQSKSYRKSVFSGAEIRVAAIASLNADCSPNAVPTVRILKKPSNGKLRIQEIRYVVARRAKSNRHHCNGKEVDANGVFYRSRPEFTGSDSTLLEIDFRNGTVRQYTYDITVR